MLLPPPFRARLCCPCLPHRPAGPQQPPFRFGKALLTAAGDDPKFLAQKLLTLTFRSPAVEREFGGWIARYQLQVGLLAFCLLAFGVVGCLCGVP